MTVFSKGSDSGRCPTLCCLYRVLAITLSWTVRKNENISDDRVLNTGRQQGHTLTVAQPQDTSTHGGNILNPSLLEKVLSCNLSVYLFISSKANQPKTERILEIDREVNVTLYKWN